MSTQPNPTTLDPKVVAQAAEAIEKAQALLITAGAGMGVDSGLPDFRGDEGFWRAYPPMKQRGLSFVDMANPRGFYKDPHLAWGFYGHRLHLYRDVEPHKGFSLLRQWGAKMPQGCFVFTSNVDGQFQKARFDREMILERHGSIHHLQCILPCNEEIWSAEGTKVSVDLQTFLASEPLPRCPHCNNLARPNVLMFGDDGWIVDRTEEQNARYKAWQKSIDPHRLVVIECGAGTAIPTVRFEGEVMQFQGATLIRINPRESQGPRNTLSLPCGASEGLHAILSAMSS
jgi:NAD-dependent SIR2 family protein deacetylase